MNAWWPIVSLTAALLSNEAAAWPFTDANWVNIVKPASLTGTVFAETVDASGDLFLGGSFAISGATADQVAEWNGSSWAPVGAGIAGLVMALGQFNGSLYAGGNFTTRDAGGVAITNIVRWDGRNWEPLGSGISDGVVPFGLGSSVQALAASGRVLYVGGSFTKAGGIPATNIAQWDGTNWAPLGSGVSGLVGDDVRA